MHTCIANEARRQQSARRWRATGPSSQRAGVSPYWPKATWRFPATPSRATSRRISPASPAVNRTVWAVVEILNLLCAGDGQDVVALREQPGEGQLRETAALVPGNLPELVDQLQVLLHVVSLEVLDALPEILLLKLGGRRIPSRQQPAAEGRICNGGDAELSASSEEML